MTDGRTEAPDDALLQLARFLGRNRRLILLTGLVGAMAMAVAAMIPRTTYTSSASFVPQSRRGGGAAMAGLAAQLGLNISAGEPSQSPAFYVELARSPRVLEALIIPKPGDSQDSARAAELTAALGVADLPAPIREDRGARKLGRLVASTANTRTGVVRLSVRLRSPELALATMNRLLAELNDFDVSSRRTQATAERDFTELRLEEALAELRSAEAALERFLVRNRDYKNSPTLAFNHDRLERDVSMRKDIYANLNEAFEQARIEAVRDTPVLTVLEAPKLPVRRDSRRVPLKVLLGLAGGLAVGLALGFGREVVRGGRLAAQGG